MDQSGRSNGPSFDPISLDEAPTVCAEGTSHTYGSHGAAHTALNTFGGDLQKNGKISYEDAREAAIKSHTDTFPLSICSPDCLRSQLDDYHKGDAKCSDESELDFAKIGEDAGNGQI